MFAFLLCLDEIQQLIHRRHQFFVVTENFAGMIQTHLARYSSRCVSERQWIVSVVKLLRFSATTFTQRGRAG